MREDPIRLVRMVNQFLGYSGGKFFTIQASWMGSLQRGFAFAS
jgi:hypothetical protein